MGMFRLGTRVIALGMCVWLAGCASSKPCDDMSDRCNAERLLYQNDMLQARMLIASGVPENFVVADALLDRAAAQDRRGEVPFYKALLKIKAGAPGDEVIGLLEQASEAEQPY